MSPGKKKQSLYDLTHAPLTEENFSALREEMIFGTDRSSALIGCTLVDVTLVTALRARFAPMSEAEDEALFYSPTAALSSFSARIKIGRAIGIFGPKLVDMLDTIRKVRNVFAHSVIPLEFTHELIVKECKTLPDTKIDKPELTHDLSPMRERYLGACARIAIILEDHAKRYAGKPVEIDIA